MKRVIFMAIIALFHLTSKGQTPIQIINPTGTKYVYVGSLVMSNNSTLNSQKLIIKILGGSWFSDSNGETSYYISNREGLNIRQVSLGGFTGPIIVLRAYQNGSNIDFYLVPGSGNYSSFAVNSFSYGYTLAAQYINITEQSTLPLGTDITSTVQIQPVTVTDGNGMVGIGTASPNAKLAVNGNIRAKEVKVENANWPDYVFSKEYELPSLQSTEHHIKEKGHLPGIPSAAEVTANGINLGEINAKLLQKIEELTLYLIDMKKEIGSQKEQSDKQIDSLMKNNNGQNKKLQAEIDFLKTKYR